MPSALSASTGRTAPMPANQRPPPVFRLCRRLPSSADTPTWPAMDITTPKPVSCETTKSPLPKCRRLHRQITIFILISPPGPSRTGLHHLQHHHHSHHHHHHLQGVPHSTAVGLNTDEYVDILQVQQLLLDSSQSTATGGVTSTSMPNRPRPRLNVQKAVEFSSAQGTLQICMT